MEVSAGVVHNPSAVCGLCKYWTPPGSMTSLTIDPNDIDATYRFCYTYVFHFVKGKVLIEFNLKLVQWGSEI